MAKPATFEELVAAMVGAIAPHIYGHPQPDWAKAIEDDIVAEVAYKIQVAQRFRSASWGWLMLHRPASAASPDPAACPPAGEDPASS